MKNNKIVHYSIISIFISLYLLVATISMINSVSFFDIAHAGSMNWVLAIAFELGAAASLAAIIILDKTNKNMVWGLFILLTLFQMMANSYHAFVNLNDYSGWIELFGLQEEEPIFQKRILSIVSGAVLPIIALGFIKSLTDYVKPNKNINSSNDFTYDEDPSIDSTFSPTKTVNNDLMANPSIVNEDKNKILDEVKEANQYNTVGTISNDHIKRITNITDDNINTDKNNKLSDSKKPKSSNNKKPVDEDNRTKRKKPVKVNTQRKAPSTNKNFTRSDGMPLKSSRRTGDYIN